MGPLLLPVLFIMAALTNSAIMQTVSTTMATTSPSITTRSPRVATSTENMTTKTTTLVTTPTGKRESEIVPLTVSIDNGETLFRPVGSDATITCSVSGSGAISVVWIGPVGNTLTSNSKYTVSSYDINTGKSTLTIFALSTTDSGSYTCRATGGSGSTVQDSITLTAYGTTSPAMGTGQSNIATAAQISTTSTNTMTPVPVTPRPTRQKTDLPTAMGTGQSNIATAAQISTTSTNTMTPVPVTPRPTRQKTDLPTGIQNQSSTCCFSENMVVMLQKDVPVVTGYVPFVSILEQTNGTDISVCDTTVLLKATFKRSNQTVSCQGCTSVPQCGNQMLKIDLWMSPNKTGVSFHVGDSKTNDGYGGDDSTQENDAEFHFYNLEQRLYGRDKCSNMSEFLMGLPNTSAHWVTIYIGNEFIRVSNPLGYSYELCSNCLFALNGQSDSQGTVNEDIYIGLNRIVRNSYFGDGSGVCGAVISWACPWKM